MAFLHCTEVKPQFDDPDRAAWPGVSPKSYKDVGHRRLNGGRISKLIETETKGVFRVLSDDGNLNNMWIRIDDAPSVAPAHAPHSMVKFTDKNGNPIWVGPCEVLQILPHYRNDELTILVCQPFSVGSLGPKNATFTMHVRETVEEVRAAFVEVGWVK